MSAWDSSLSQCFLFLFHRYTIFKDHVTLDDCILVNSLKKKSDILYTDWLYLTMILQMKSTMG